MILEGSAKSLEEKVFTVLEEQILSGRLKSGEALTELSLSEKLGVSRTPVRGALHKLADEGLVELLPNRGARVIGVGERELVDIYKIRMRLEGLAAGIAAERMTDADKERLRDAVELSEFYITKNDAEHLKELDTEFHSIIYNSTGNRLLGKMLTGLHKSIKTYRKMSLSDKGRLKKSVLEHREILEAILKGDSAEADRLTTEHISLALENILGALGSESK